MSTNLFDGLAELHAEAQVLTAAAETKARERNAALVVAVDSGKSQAALARVLGLSRQRLGALVAKGREYAE